MKIIKYLLFILPLSFFCQQQEEAYLIKNIRTLRNKNPDWKIEESDITREEKLKLITDIFNNDSTSGYCRYGNIKTAADFLNNFKNVFHFVDIDNDSDVDVIFSGITCPGSEAGAVVIYTNKNKKLKKKLIVSGKIVEFTKNGSLITYGYPCCAMTTNTLKYYRILGDSLEDLTGVLFHTYKLSKTKTKIFPSNIKPGKTVQLKYGTIVKLAAIDSLFQDAVISAKSVDIAKTKDGAEVKIYSSYKDKAKQKWLYVKIACSDLIYDESLHNVNIRTTSLLGWIKAVK